MPYRVAPIAFAATAAMFSPLASADTFDLGNLSASGLKMKIRSFDAVYNGGFTDHYTFSLASLGTISGDMVEVDGYLKPGGVSKIKDLDVKSLVLEQKGVGGGYETIGADFSPENFSFASLSGGDYRLIVKGIVVPTVQYSPSSAVNGGMSRYSLMASTAPAIAPVPEIDNLIMTAMGLASVGFFWARRRKP
jgi:hypothetical protein